MHAGRNYSHVYWGRASPAADALVSGSAYAFLAPWYEAVAVLARPLRPPTEILREAQGPSRVVRAEPVEHTWVAARVYGAPNSSAMTLRSTCRRAESD